MLATTITGSDDLPNLLIVHGLFGSARNWGVISKRLSCTYRVIAVDMRNHGNSAWQPTQSYGDMAGDLAEILTAEGGAAHVLGHSMGGKAAMVLALKHPGLVAKLVIADVAPVAYGHTQMPLIEAMRGLDLGRISTRRDADIALADTVSDPGVRAFLLQSLDLTSPTPRWRLNLDVLADEMPLILGFPDVAGVFTGQTLVLTGQASDYVKPAHHARIHEFFPHAAFQDIPGAGHWLHAEKPREFEAALRGFLAG